MPSDQIEEENEVNSQLSFISDSRDTDKDLKPATTANFGVNNNSTAQYILADSSLINEDMGGEITGEELYGDEESVSLEEMDDQ